ncbi:TPA: YadA C-terminal domain-containing protein [Escherichia coli]
MTKKISKTIIAGAVFGAIMGLSAQAQAQTSHQLSFSLYQGEFDTQTSAQNLSSQKFKITFNTDSGMGLLSYGTNASIRANSNKPIYIFDSQGNVYTTLDDGRQLKVHSEDVADFVRSITDGNYASVADVHNMNEGEVRSLVQKVESIKQNIKTNDAYTQSAIDEATSFAIDANGNITLDEELGSGERYSVKGVVAELVDDSTVRVAQDGSLTKARDETTTTKRVSDALIDMDQTVRNNAATVATNTTDIATNKANISKNTAAIQSNSRQLQEHNARLNDHQRQIRENHEEMKRAAAQSAALAGLFQPYSVGKFNATAALGGYSDKQAVAVGVGYRFNEQTAAKAGIAASDGDVSYNVGVNFEF